MNIFLSDTLGQNPPLFSPLKRFLLAIVLGLGAAVGAHGQALSTGVLATDNAGNYSSFTATSSTPADGGSGWGAWTWGNSNSGGEYLSANSSDSGGDKIRVTGSSGTDSWGVYANASGSALASIYRTFPTSTFAVGDTVTLQWENGSIANGGSTGVSLWNSSNNNVWEMFFSGGNGNYFFNDSNGANDNSGIGFTNGGLQLDFTLTSATSYSVTVAELNASGTTTLTGGLANPSGGQTISELRFFSFGNTSQDTFFNKVKDLIPTFTASSGNWNSTANWVNNGTVSDLPINGANVAFSNSVGGTATNNQMTTVNSITFNSGAGGYTLTGTSAGANVTLGDAGAESNAGIVNSSTVSQTVAENLTIGTGAVGTTFGAAINAASGPLVLSGSLNLNGSRVQVTGTAAVTLSGVVSGASDILLQGTGATLYLTNANNTFGANASGTANVYIDAGTVSVGATGALGSTTGGTTGFVDVGSNVANETNNNSGVMISTGGVNVANPIDIRYVSGDTYGTQQIGGSNTSGTATFSGPIVLHNSVTINSAAGGTVNVSGPISQGSTTGIYAAENEAVNGTPGVTLTGSGIVQFSGTNTYLGGTTVNGGTLVVSGSLAGSATVASAASMEVDGVLSSTGSTTINGGVLQGNGFVGAITANGGTVSPGLTAANAGSANDTLTAGGDVNLSGSTTFALRIGTTSATTNDALVTSGNFNAGGATLSLSLSGNINTPSAQNNVYTIVTAGSAPTGTFAGLPSDGSTIDINGFTFAINYDVGVGGNSDTLTLTAIPEPGTFGLILGGMGMLIAIQRKRRR